MDAAALKSRLSAFGQSHLVQFWDELSPSDQENLAREIESIDFGQVCSYYQRSAEGLAQSVAPPISLTPIDSAHCGVAKDLPPATLESFWDCGLEEISLGHVGVLLMAGGQGTRLGVAYPKGMFDVGLPSHKSLFQLQAERIRRLEGLAQQAHPGSNGKIMWYIMTSEATRDETTKFFQQHSYFGLEEGQMNFFVQGQLPCLTFEGKVILAAKGSIAMAPDGNGGLYRALRVSGALDHMQRHQIRHIHVYGVDNVLVRVGDPTFIGFCVKREADCAAKTVTKEDPQEAVGVVCLVEGGIPQVVEYSEISKDLADKREANGSLVFRAGNIANHYFHLNFLDLVCQSHDEQLPHHVAKKKIPFVDAAGKTVKPSVANGIKLEKFVFDVFQFSKRFHIWEVDRRAEFSPLKNNDSAGVECPSTCRADIYRLHRQWLIEAGAKLGDEVVEFEISPLMSYCGEGCADLVNGKEFLKNPLLLSD